MTIILLLLIKTNIIFSFIKNKKKEILNKKNLIKITNR